MDPEHSLLKKYCQITHRKLFVFAVVTIVLAFVALVLRHTAERLVKQKSIEIATERAANAAELIEGHLKELMIAGELADQATQEKLSNEQIINLLKERLGAAEHLAMLTAAFTNPVAAEPPVFTTWSKSGVELSRLDAAVVDDDAHDIHDHWYWSPMREGQGVWSETPCYSPTMQLWLTGGYSAPFFREDDSGQLAPAGVISADITLSMIREEVFKIINVELDSLPVESSYAFVVTQSGTVVSYPDTNVVTAETNIDELFALPGGFESIEKFPRVSSNSDVRMLAFDNPRGFIGKQLLFFAPIAASESSADWWVVIAVDAHRILAVEANHRGRRRLNAFGLVSALLAIFAMTNLLIRVDLRGIEGAWFASTFFAFLCCAGIVGIWFLHERYETKRIPIETKDILLANNTIAGKIQLQHEVRQKREPTIIPTGIFIQSAEFGGSNNVTVTGYLWQKYAKDLPNDVFPSDDSPGFVFPESEETDVEIAYREENDGMIVWGWYFRAVLRQNFNYRHYPFDSEDVWFRIWHRDLGKGVLLTPDFDAFASMVPTDLPGLETEDFVLEGWTLTQSYFSYRLNSYNVDFGLQPNPSQTDFPELYFHIGMDRMFTHPFIANLLPLAIVALLLFAILLTARIRDHSEHSGFSAVDVLSFCAALFFVVIVSHISLREQLNAKGLIYLEHFYFVSYLGILAVSISSLLLISPFKSPLLEYHDNLVTRLAFWPVCTGMLLVLTIWEFS